MSSQVIGFQPGRKDAASSRAGSTLLFVVGAVAVVAAVGGAAWFLLGRGRGPATEEPLVTEVIRGPYEHTVTEQGEVESANNIDVRCEVRARVSSGPSTSIIDIVPEGSFVKKGDWLITFDSSTLEQDRRQQKIAVNSSEAVMIQAKALYDTALIAEKEYLEGTYREQEKTIENQIFVAEENLKKAQLSFDSTKRLVSRGLLTALQLEGEKFRVDAAANELDLAKRKLDVLAKFTRIKMLTQLQSDIQAAEVKYKNERDNFQEEQNKLKDIEDQIANCRVLAPQDGQVVYANVQSSRSGSEFVVEAGSMVRERQVIIRLPDPKDMQVRAKINESRINLVREGMAVSVRVDAFGDGTLVGEVTKVNKYAEAGNFWNSTAKQYATLIKIHDPPPQLRVGLTAEVRIQIEQRPDAMQIPVQAVYERGGKTFCLVKTVQGWDTREIVISSTNDNLVALDENRCEGLRAGDIVVMNPRRHVDKFDASRFPESPAESVPVVAGAGQGPTEKVAAQRSGSLEAKPGQGSSALAAVEGASGSPGQPQTVPDDNPKRKANSPAQLMQRLDTDGDGKLAASEWEAAPASLRDRLISADTNSSGSIEMSELGAALARVRAAGDGTQAVKPGGAE